MQRSFETQTEHLGQIAVLSFFGEISGLSDPALQDAFAKASANQPAIYLLDLAGVDYINSTGIALLVRLIARARQAGQKVAVSGLSEHYTEIFRITRLVDYVSLFPDRDTGLKSLRTTEQPQEGDR